MSNPNATNCHRGFVILWLPRVTLVALLLALGWTIAAMFWMFWPYDVIQLKKLQVLSDASPGGELVLRLDYCKSAYYADLPSEVQYTYHDGLSYGLLGASVRELPVGCGVTMEVILVPVLPFGKYKVEMIRSYKVNLIRTMTYRIISNEFELKAK